MIEGSAVSQTDKRLVSNLFSFTHFLQARTNWTKLKASVREVLKSADIQVTQGELSQGQGGQDQCVDELLDMMRGVKWAIMKNKDRSTVLDTDDDPSHTTGMKKHLEKEKLFKSMWNVGFSSTPKHVCNRLGPSPCCRNDEESYKKMADSMIDLAFSSIPSTPAPGKWTRLWEPLAFLTFTVWTRILQPCFDKIVTSFGSNPGELDPDVDPALQSVLQWAKITGTFA